MTEEVNVANGAAGLRHRPLLNRRALVQWLVDALLWGLAVTLSALLRVDFRLDKLELVGQVAVVPVAAAIQLAAGWLFGLYVGRWRFGSFDEVAALARAVALSTVVLFALDALTNPRLVPLSAVVGGGIAALVLMAGVRYLWRLRLERRRRPSGETLQRLVVVGAGEGGAQVVASMLRDPSSPFLPVALLDDDPAKSRLRISGVPVVGTTADLRAAAATVDADTVLVAIPSAGRDLLTRITDAANEAKLTVKVLPGFTESLRSTVDVRDVRDVSPLDLLGRHEVNTGIEDVAGYLRGRRVLVTGAGGSIGSELCRQISTFEPAALFMLDRDESALHALKLSISGRALLDTPDLVLGDLRDEAAMDEVFRSHRPEVVFHAAALKHLPLLERHPAEGYKTNVLGTAALLRIAAAHGVERFVNISTDKAADPGSVLGYTKRIAERLTADMARKAPGIWLSVRFGNVLGSRGSMLDAFQAQIAAGGPITVTDPEVTRFFMTVNEAVHLVIQAGAIGEPGEAMVLDMGEPVRIAAVAELLAAQAGDEIGIVYTGLRPGEKLHEVLVGGDEDARPSAHPSISRVRVPPLEPADVLGLSGDGPDLVARLRDVAASGRHDPATPAPASPTANR